jgi:crotonobetainyl-CoA:carnitine CoA-transferase CaiB-like acyl-CoA transferase
MKPQAAATPHEIAADVWRDAGGAEAALGHLGITGAEPVLPSVFRVDAAAGATIGLAGLAAADFHRVRTGGAMQQVEVDLPHAAASFQGESRLYINDAVQHQRWKSISGYYRAGDGRWLQLHCNFPHFRDGVLRLLGCEEDRDAVAKAIARWDGEELETRLIGDGLAAAMMRSLDEWKNHPQAVALEQQPLISIEKIGEAPAEAPGRQGGALAGIRVLDLSRVIAGPVCGRTLAGFGADVIRISSPDLPYIEDCVIATGFGKYAAHVDLRTEDGRATLSNLVHNADVFLQAYRPDSIAARGFAAEQLAEQRPGIVYVELCAFGWDGPWAGRRGYDSIVQTTTGIAHEGMRVYGTDRPKPLPCQALDHATGYLAAFGATMALRRRAEEGGSWLVRVSLAQTRNWLTGLGRAASPDIPMPGNEDFNECFDRMESAFGSLRYISPAMRLSATPPAWERPPSPLGIHPPIWPS